MEAVRRLWLGVLLISVVSAGLLLSEGRGSSPAREPGGVRRWSIEILAFITAADSKECERGMKAGLAESLKEGTDYATTIRNAQGDMPTLSSLVDAALGSSADLIMTLSTPTLQAALQRVKTTPIVFSFSSNPIGAGAGKTYIDHLPNVTGVATTAAYDDLLQVIQDLLPSAHRLGTLVVPSEVNSVYNTEQLRIIAQRRGLELVTLPVNSSSEIADAALALLSQPIDAICQVPSNLTITGFASIAKPAQRQRMPVFGFLTADVENGAVVSMARDYFEAGRQSGRLAARVIRGENPSAIPIEEVGSTKLLLNQGAARILGLTLPPSLIERASRVVE